VTRGVGATHEEAACSALGLGATGGAPAAGATPGA